MRRWLALIPLVVLVGLTVLFVGWSLQRQPEHRPDALIGQPLPTRALPVLEGEAASARTLTMGQAADGRPVVVNLFASWCAPCRLEHPHLMALKARGVRVIGVAYKDDPARTRAFLDELGDPFDVVLIDAEGRAGLDLGLSGVPESFAVATDGRITAKASGPLTSDAEAARLFETARAGR